MVRSDPRGQPNGRRRRCAGNVVTKDRANQLDDLHDVEPRQHYYLNLLILLLLHKNYLNVKRTCDQPNTKMDAREDKSSC